MAANPAQIGQWMTILTMAAALGLDAFSLGMGLGTRILRWSLMLKLSVLIGLLHMLMPLVGMAMGDYAGQLLDNVAVMAGGGLLVLLGSHMIWNSFRSDRGMKLEAESIWGMLLFALSVSIDSMSVGVSMGLFASDVPLTALSFGLSGGSMAVAGLILGRRVGRWAGEYGEALGGVVLLVFGIRILV